MEYCQLRKRPNYAATWTTSYSNEISHLCQGIGRNTEETRQHVEGTDTLFVVHYNHIPADRQIYHLHLGRLQVTPTKGGPQPHENHHRRQPHMLSWRCWHTHRLTEALQIPN